MKEKVSGPKKKANPRKRAGAPAVKREPKRGSAELERALHELRMFKAELEIQNEELRKTQEELASSKEKYAGLYNFAPVGYFTFDRSGVIEDANVTGAEMLGTDRDSLVGKLFTKFVHSADRDKFTSHLREVLDRKVHVRCELRIRNIGVFFAFPVQLQSIAVEREQGEWQCRTVISDMTELQRLRSERESYIRDLESFGSAASHELRGPLVAIAGFARALGEDYGECFDEEGRKVVEVINEKARQMEKLLSALLEFSKISTSQVRKRPIRMNDLIDNVCKELTAGKKRQVRFENTSVPHAHGDPRMIHQVVMNLVSNALKYSSKNPRPSIEIGGDVEGSEVVYYVKDNGIGFDPKYSHKLFDLFQRLHSAKEFAGTGTGLYVARRIVEKHGGRIWAESRPGEGSTFYFALPTE